MDKYIGKLLDNRYEVLETIGIGGMAIIYKARCRVLNRFVAIKILKDEFARDEEFRRRFYMESQAVAKLSHPNIVSVYDVSHTEGLEYIVMELVEGVTLKEYLQKKSQLSWQETLFFAQQIARALAHAHSRGIIHQDIKPQNIMITNEGQAKVTDFGIASFAANQETRVVQEAIGSVHYISPEQAKGSNVDFRTDIYSLGVVMYEMLTGKLPFEGETALSIVMQHISAMPLRPSEVVEGVPHGMDEIVMHAMCPAVARRYASADDLYADLQKLKTDAHATFTYNCDSVRGDVPALDATQSLPQFEEIRKAPVPKQEYAPRPQQSKTTTRQKERGVSPAVVAVIAVVGFAVVAVIVAMLLVFGGGNSTEKIKVLDFRNMDIKNVIDVDTGEVNPEFSDFKFATEKVPATNQSDGLIFDQDPAPNTRVSVGATITLRYYVGNTKTGLYTVPPMKDTTKTWVQETIDQHNNDFPDNTIVLQFIEEPSDKIEKDRVIRTEPAEGSKLRDGEKLVVYISTGPEEPEEFDMPDLTGKTLDNATNTLSAHQMTVGSTQTADSDKPAGTIIDQDPKAGSKVKVGDVVKLTISSGKTAEPKPEETVPPTGEEGGGSGGTAQAGKATVTVAIPEDARGSAHVVISLSDGTTVYDKTLTNTDASVSVTITGSGDQYATVYVNGAVVGEQAVSFG